MNELQIFNSEEFGDIRTAEIDKKVFAECNRDIKTYFTVNARNNIPKLRFEESMEYVRNWHPCTNTVMMIRDCNAQMSIS